MKVTDVSLRIVNNCRHLKAVASLVIDGSLIINDIFLIDNGKKIFIDFPKNKRYESIIVPIADNRHYIEQTVLENYIKKVGHDVLPFDLK